MLKLLVLSQWCFVIAVGGVILLEAMFTGPITKASMNPIRSLAHAIVSGNLQLL
ncbi:aquaporin [Ichthyenterobacterium magnum]|uniref:aquaporin n=1 Tax=Ichthyenterobacterium magnum TaxID=1230530 RepID=UPI001FE3B83D|nr:aquaporin [Ichthyenterobacterium magnum]